MLFRSSHDAIEEAAAIGVEDEKFGQRLKAFVALRDGQELTEDEVKKYVKENLANYKVPREVVFVDELPRNPTGKVLKRELQEKTEEGSDEESGKGADDESVRASDEGSDGSEKTSGESESNGGEKREKEGAKGRSS